MKKKTFEEIVHKVKGIKIKGSVDMVIGIAESGIIPAYLIAKKLKKPVDFIWINFRDKNNRPRHPHPKLTKPYLPAIKNKHLLLVDDVSRTSSTIHKAKQCLRGAKSIKTFVFNGSGDYNLYNEECFIFPWAQLHKSR